MNDRVRGRWLLAAALALGCGGTPPAPPATAAKQAKRELGAPVRAQALHKTAYLQFAVYYRARDGADPSSLVREKLQGAAAGLKLVPKLDEQPSEPQLVVVSPPLEQYSPPSRDLLEHFGRGFDAAAEERLRQVDQVLVLELVAPVSGASSAQRQALELVGALVEEFDGFAWDEVTREVFTRAAWKERVASFDVARLNVADHITTHFYRSDAGPRLITLGMAKFGLPDVVVENLPASSARAMRALTFLICQTLLERGRIERDGKLDLDIAALREPGFRAAMQESMLGGARGKATVDLAEGRWQDGDPQNRLIEVVFPGKHDELHIRQDKLISVLFGFEDSLVQVQHDAELEAASQRAKQELLSLKPRFAQPKSSEVLLVKAPFATPSGGNEWMWVEVTSWSGKTISGILQNQPYEVPNLRSGARVSFDESTVFDYIHHRDDGSEVGNETGKLMLKRQQEAGAN